MLTVLRCISQYCDPSPASVKGIPDIHFQIAKSDFKIVYVAPMKALAAEIVEKMGKRLKFLGVSVREFTGKHSLFRYQNMYIVVNLHL